MLLLKEQKLFHLYFPFQTQHLVSRRRMGRKREGTRLLERFFPRQKNEGKRIHKEDRSSNQKRSMMCLVSWEETNKWHFPALAAAKERKVERSLTFSHFLPSFYFSLCTSLLLV